MISKNLSMKELLMALDISSDGFYIYDGNLKLLYANAAAMRVNQLDSSAMGKSWFDLKKAGHLYGSAAPDALHYKKKVTSEFITDRGEHLHCIATPILDNKGEVKYLISNIKNITDLNMLRQELVEYQCNVLSKTFLFNSPQMKRIVELIETIAKTDVSVLICGETGVGKSDIAKLLHKLSIFSEAPFISINCGAIAPTLCDAEFFGYEKGAFTDAHQSKKGIFESANHSTLFLDEIGDLPLFMQVKLLRVLQEKKIKRLGSEKEISVDFRIVAATNRNIQEMVKSGEFREDLYYRLNGMSIEIPPLRERPEDIKVLLSYFIQQYNIKHNTMKTFSQELTDALLAYNFPGNIRELAYLVERLIILSPDDVIKNSVLLQQTQPALKTELDQDILPYKEVMENTERNLLLKAKRKYKSMRAMGKALGLSHVAIARKMKKYNIE